MEIGNWIDQSRGLCNTNSIIRFKTTMFKSSLYDDSDAYIHVKGRITIAGAGDDVSVGQADERNKSVICGNLLNLLSNFLRNINQRVVLNGQIFSWADVKAEFLKAP